MIVIVAVCLVVVIDGTNRCRAVVVHVAAVLMRVKRGARRRGWQGGGQRWCAEQTVPGCGGRRCDGRCKINTANGQRRTVGRTERSRVRVVVMMMVKLLVLISVMLLLLELLQLMMVRMAAADVVVRMVDGL